MRMTRQGVRPDITFMVGGLLVSGILVGFREYLEGIASHFRAATSDTPGVGPAIASEVDTVIAELDAEGLDDNSSGQDSSSTFIHLKDAHVRGPGGQFLKVPWWRGRLRAVDGFFFGTPT
jgi:hypothetical protein